MSFKFQILREVFPQLLDGLQTTIIAAALAIVLGLIWGVLIGTITHKRIRILSPICRGYVIFFRETPLLVQLYFLFFGLARVIKVPAFLCGVLGLMLNDGAFISEIVRGGLQGIDKGQWEAASSLGFTYLGTLRYFAFPQMWKKVQDSLLNMMSIIIKDTSLLMWITITELSYQTQQINIKRFEPITAFVTAAVLYYALFLLVQGVRKLLGRRRVVKYDLVRS